MISLHPVVVTKIFPWGAASSMVTTSKPAIAAWRALIGSISVMMTRDPYDRRDSAHYVSGIVRRLSLKQIWGERETDSFSDISVTSDNSDLSSKHNIGGTFDTINKGLSASVKVVELGLGDYLQKKISQRADFRCMESRRTGVVDVDGGDL